MREPPGSLGMYFLLLQEAGEQTGLPWSCKGAAARRLCTVPALSRVGEPRPREKRWPDVFVRETVAFPLGLPSVKGPAAYAGVG